MLAILAVIYVSAVTFFRNINSFPLRNWDEAWYAEIIKNMASGHSLLVPFWNGRYYFDKPPLYFWLSLPFFKIFGPGEWQARIVSAAAGVLACTLVYLIAKKLINQTVGVLSVVVFLTMGEVVIRFAHGNLDALLVASILLTFYLYLLADKKNHLLILSGISLGAVALTKGWIFVLFPLFLIIVYSHLVEKKIPKNLPLLIIPPVLIVSIFFLLGTIEFGKTFLSWYLANPSADLLNSPIKSFSLQYLKQTIVDIGPWFLPVFLSLLFIRKLKEAQKHLILAFLIVSILYIFALNFLSEKLGWYLLPAYPFIAIAIGICVANLYKKWPKLSVIIILAITAISAWNAIRIENIYPDRSKVGATLGQYAKELIPKEDTVILDDHDLTSFLYYSNHGEIFVSQDNPGKDWEWWIKTYTQIPDFAQQRDNTWIITKNPESFAKIPTQAVSQSNGYTFLLTTF